MFKKIISPVSIILILTVLILGAIQIIKPEPAYARSLPCCNQYGWRLCDPQSPWWDYPLWSCDPKVGEEVNISPGDCVYNWNCSIPKFLDTCAEGAK
jgi:hypothetical protein